MLRRSRIATMLALALGAALAGCGISPQPEPPFVERGQLMLMSDGMTLTLSGRPGAVGPADERLTVTVINLDSPEPAMVIPAAPDGSFVTGPFVDAGMMPMPELRVFVTDGAGVRSEPVDIVAAPDGTVLPAPRPLESCLAVPPELDLGEVAADDIVLGQHQVRNDCAEPVILEFVTARVGTDFFPTLGMRGPVVLERGRTRNIGVSLEPSGATGPVEDIVFLQVSGMDGTSGRRPFDVRGEVTPLP